MMGLEYGYMMYNTILNQRMKRTKKSQRDRRWEVACICFEFKSFSSTCQAARLPDCHCWSVSLSPPPLSFCAPLASSVCEPLFWVYKPIGIQPRGVLIDEIVVTPPTCNLSYCMQEVLCANAFDL